MVKQLSSEEVLLRMMLFPEDVVLLPIQYPNVPNTQYSNPQGGTETIPATWPQTGALTFASTHRNTGRTINDLSGDPLQLFIVIKDEVTNIARIENKNPSGKDVPYSAVSPEGTRNFIIPAVVIGTGVAPITTELKPISAVFDPTALSLFQTATASGWLFNAAITANANFSFPTGLAAQQAQSLAAHGLILPVGKFDGHHGLFLDETGVTGAGTAGLGATPTPQNSLGAGVAGSGASGIFNLADSQNLAASCFVIATGDTLTGGSSSAPIGWGQWVVNDTLSVNMYQFNEDDNTEATWSFQVTIASGQNAANVPLAFVPTNGSDLYYFVVSAEVTTALAAGATINVKRSIRISFTCCGGIFEHHMAPYINDAYVLGSWVETRSLATSVSCANFTADYGKSGLALYRQCDPGSYWQEQGLDQRLPGGPYQFNCSVRGVSKIEMTYGERGWLGICGRERLFWRKNIGTISQNANLGGNLGAGAGVPGSTPAYNVCYDAQNENIGVMVLKSNGVGNATNAIGITPAQGIEIQLAHKWEGKNADRSKGVMEQRLPMGLTEAQWNAVGDRASTMMRAGPADSVNMQYYLDSENWREKMQQGTWDGNRKYIRDRKRGI